MLGAFTKATATCVVVGFMTGFHVLPGANVPLSKAMFSSKLGVIREHGCRWLPPHCSFSSVVDRMVMTFLAVDAFFFPAVEKFLEFLNAIPMLSHGLQVWSAFNFVMGYSSKYKTFVVWVQVYNYTLKYKRK